MAAIDIMDVFLRDGLQDEDVVVPTRDKLTVAEALLKAGLRRIEVASFVNPAKVPQMADAADVLAGLPPRQDAEYTCLVLNARGVDRAVAAGARSIQVVSSASQAHSKANAGRSVEDAIADLGEAVARHPDVSFLAGVSSAFVCPFDGDVDPDYLLFVVRLFKDIGVGALGLADTVGTASTSQVIAALDHVTAAEPDLTYSLHLHNAGGQALDTVSAAVDRGITRFDSALGGFGGCPFAPGAHGNLATEDLVRHLHAAGHDTGIDPGALATAAHLARSVVSSAAVSARS